MEKGWKPQVEISPTCPRCGSLNTKFCYYNNYSLTQPRYFCKGCRRYWTKGGSLRNVPVGGGCRKSRRSKPYSDVISIPSRGVSGRPLVALSHSGINSPILSPSTNGSLARIDGSNIDLALVYANFLNQKPRPNEAENYSPHHQIEIPILPNAVSGGPSSCQFSGVEGIHTDLRINQLSYGNGFVDQCRPLSDRSSETHFNINNAFYLSGLDSFEKQADYQFSTSMENQTNNYGLPSLPGEELTTVVSEGLLWSGSNDIIFPSHTLHATQLSGIKEPPHDLAQEPINQLGDNGSQFDVQIELCNVFRP